MLDFLLTDINTHEYNNAALAVRDQTRKLSSGLKIVHAGDDPSNLSLGSRLNGTALALRTATEAVTLTQRALDIADGALSSMQTLLARMKSLAIQAASATLSDTERAFLHVEFDAVREEICRTADDTELNGKKLFGGSACLDPLAHFPFDPKDFNLVAVVPNRASAGTDVNGNGIADAGDGVEFDFTFTNNTTDSITGISIDPATARTDVPVTQNGGGTGYSGGIGTGGTGLLSADLGAFETVTTDSIQDLDLHLAAGTDGISFNQVLDLTYTFQGQVQRVELIFGPSVVGAIANNDQVPLISVDGIAVDGSDAEADTLSDRRVGSLVGVDALPTEDKLDVVIPYISLYNLDPNLLTASLESVAGAETAIGTVDRALTALVDARATVAADAIRADFAAKAVDVAVLHTAKASSDLLNADVAQELAQFTSKRLLLQANIATQAQNLQQVTQQARSLIGIINAIA